jgi:hypothetical protein
VDKLLLIGVIEDSDLERLLVMIDPLTWDPEKERCKKNIVYLGYISNIS